MSSNEAIVALRAAGSALGDVDVSGWDETALTDQLADLSDALCQLDAQLSRVAEAVRARFPHRGAGCRLTVPGPAVRCVSLR